MKVLIATSSTPLVDGGATLIVDWLREMITMDGHEAEVLSIPFSSQYSEILEQMTAMRLLDVSAAADRLIAIRFPSYLLQHPNKVVWFIHHHRSAYDLWGTSYQDIPNTPEGVCIRNSIHRADDLGLREAKGCFCNSQVMAARLRKFNDIEAEVLYPPLLHPEAYFSREFGDYFLYISRLTHHKRQWLAIEALRYTRNPVKLVIVGRPDPDSASYLAELQSLVERHKLIDRVSIIADWVSEKEKIELLAGSLGAIYLPFDEDSYGYPTLEAHCAGKPVLSTTDSGGTRELVIEAVTGFLPPPDAQAIAVAMDRLYQDRTLACSLGANGRMQVARLGITRERVLERLLG